MNKSKFVALLIGLAGVTASAQALAEGGGFLLGGSLGRAQAKEDACSDTTGFSCDRTGKVAYSVFASLMMNRYFGVEVGYHDLGTLVEQLDVATQTQHVAAKTKLSEFVFIAAYPWLDRVSLYAKGGGYYAKSTRTSDFLPPAESKARQYTYGGGVSWDVFRHAGLRLEYQRYNNIGGAEVGFHTDVELVSVGAYFKF